MKLWKSLARRSDVAAEKITERAKQGAGSVADRVEAGQNLERIRANRRRNYEMAEDDRLSSRWSTTTRTADGELRYSLSPLRSRARELAENDPYVSRLFQMLDENVVGEEGIRPIPEPMSTRNRRQVDKYAERQILEGFSEWSRQGVTTVCGTYSLAALQKRIIRSVGTDGELFLVEVIGEDAGNRFGYALEVIEADLVDETHNEDLANGNAVRMGVEVNEHRRPVAYWFLTSPKGDYRSALNPSNVQRRRVPADRVIYCARRELMRPGQTRAVSWLTTAGPQLYQLHGYRKAEAVAARTGSEKMGFYKMPAGDDYDGGEVDASAFIQESEAGTLEVLPEGVDFVTHDPDHPSTAFADFNKAVLRGIAAGLGVGYNDLARDLEGVSYGSLRQSSLDDRAHYRALRTWIVESCGFRDRIYPHWLESAALGNAIKLDPAKLGNYRAHRWQARGWRWIDPDKESKGDERALGNGTRLVEDVVAETTGRTLDEHLERLAIERQKFDALGLSHPIEPDPVAPEPEPEPPEEAEE